MGSRMLRRAGRHGLFVAAAVAMAAGCAELAGLSEFGNAPASGTGGSTSTASTGSSTSGGGQTSSGGGAANCDDGIACTVDTTGPEGCTNTPDDTLCDDGFACTTDVCAAEGCIHATDDTDCGDGDPCSTGSCDAAQGCVQAAVADGTGCGDGSCDQPFECTGGVCSGSLACPGQSTCNAGVCTGCVSAADCPSDVVGNWSACSCKAECSTTGTRQRDVTSFNCNAGTCEQQTTMEMGSCSCVTDGDPCSVDGNTCTTDVCAGGACTHVPLPDGSQCLGEGQNYLCCGGSCKATQSDHDHCGGCFVDCAGTLGCNNGYCRACVDDQDCSDHVSAGFTCNQSANPNRCQCSNNASCPMSWQFCNNLNKCRGDDD